MNNCLFCCYQPEEALVSTEVTEAGGLRNTAAELFISN